MPVTALPFKIPIVSIMVSTLDTCPPVVCMCVCVGMCACKYVCVVYNLCFSSQFLIKVNENGT